MKSKQEVPSQPDPIVDVVIPTFNYAQVVVRAIRSVRAQTLQNFTCTIVDDGSSDDTRAVVEEEIANDSRFQYVYQNNAGVAVARNSGIALGQAPFVCCLDADDQIRSEFLEACVRALQKDRALGIAYTGLWYVLADKKEGLSQWPGEFVANNMLKKQNQIPTCCVYRRTMWSRTGGYRQRYAPEGAGSEDAEFFLRAISLGFNARKVTDAGLFVYSWKSGRVSGNPNYREIDWTTWHPWVKDNLHPFASVVVPSNDISHPALFYDEPTISVIIPVGKGHEITVVDALDSLEAQTFRKWEAIVVSDDTSPKFPHGGFRTFQNAFPFVRFYWTDAKDGPRGPGHARNLGVKYARAPLLLFLDADDWLYPNALYRMLNAFYSSESIIYTDYVGKVYMEEKDALKLGERLLQYDSKHGEAVIRYYSQDYDCERAINMFNNDERIYIWNLISSLVPKPWHDGIGGFDEKMPSWEDWDYWVRMAKAGRCFERVPEDLLVYRFYTGGRRQKGIEENKNLIEYLKNKYRSTKTMPCNCGGRKNGMLSTATVISASSSAVIGAAQKMVTQPDESYLLCEYTHPNKGVHKVVGAATKQVYGYRGGGERFYVHRNDIALEPHNFRIVEVAPLPREERVELSPPKPIAPPPAPKEKAPLAHWDTNNTPSPAAEEWTSNATFIPEAADGISVHMIPGVTPAIASALEEIGVLTSDGILKLGEEGLLKVKGIGKMRAAAIIAFLTAPNDPE